MYLSILYGRYFYFNGILLHMTKSNCYRIGRIFLILFTLFFLCVGNMYAAEGDGTVNYYADMMDDSYYADLLKYVFDGNPLDGVMERYVLLEEHMTSSDYEDWMKSAALARAALICGRYAEQCGDEDLATDFMEMADGKIAEAREEGAPESAVGVLEALSLSFWYLIDGSISKGMKFPKMADNLYKNYSEDFHVLLLEADRYLHSPGIVGGNKKKGLSLFQEAEAVMNQNGAAIWDKFSVYSGLAFGYDSRKDKENAKKYTDLAYEIYKADETVNELREKYN